MTLGHERMSGDAFGLSVPTRLLLLGCAISGEEQLKS